MQNLIKSTHEVVPGLWIGNEAAARDSEFLSQIDVVINATNHLDFYPGNRIKIRVPVDDPGPLSGIISNNNWDIDRIKMLQYLPIVVPKIYNYRKEGKRILIHCHAGAQRSAAIMVSYIVKHGVWNISPERIATTSDKKIRELKYKSAVDLLVRIRPVAFFGGTSVNFEHSIKKYLEI